MQAIVRNVCKAGGILVLLIPCVCEAAPEGSALPGYADPGRIIQDLTPIPEPQPLAAPQVVSPEIAAVHAPPGAGQAIFLMNHAIVEGATVYDGNTLESVFRPYYGQYLSLRKLYELAATITHRYRDDGYALSQAIVPPQKITGGTVHIRIVEGYIDKIETQGAYRESMAARGIIERIEHDRPLNIKHLERELLLLGDLNGVSVRAVLNPREGEDDDRNGVAGLTLVFADVPAPSTAGIDNFGSRYTGPMETSVSTGINHLPFPYEQTQINGLAGYPFNEMQYVQASQRMPLNSWGTTATLQLAYAHSEPGYRLMSEEIDSNSWNYDLSVAHPLIRSREQNLTVGADFTVKDIATDALGNELYHDRLRIIGISASYDRSDGWGGSNLVQTKLSQGLDLAGATETGSPDLSCADGHSDFTRATGNAGRLQTITDSVRLYVAGEGQYAWSPLLSSEQFGFGGQQFGRAYDASELTGDDGLAALAELRYDPPSFLPDMHPELFGFYDIGRVWDYNSWSGGESAASAGFGVRFALGPHLSGSLMLAKPLTHMVAAPEYGNGKAPRAFFSLTGRF